MKLLLDTHIFLWFITGDKQIPDSTVKTIRDPANEVYLSAASFWEIVIKYQIGKLPLPGAPETYIPAQRARHLIASLPVDEASVAELSGLPLLHQDPFDRIIVGQALHHGMTIVTFDRQISAYPVRTL
jgi:PIN domain nuclease of toxin-antitoxin system